MARKLTTEDFIEEAKGVHGEKYDYSKVEYKTRSNKIIIICPIHGEFEQEPRNHLSGHGCKYCKYEAQSMSQEEFVYQSNEKHKNKYSYENTIYVSNKTKVIITCPIHGDFEQTPNRHLTGYGCNSCGNISSANIRKTTLAEFIAKANKIHNYLYSYSKVEYVNNKTKVIITCKAHGDFEQSPLGHLKAGCPSCAEYGFNPNKPAILYYLKITTDDNQVLYKIGITNRTVDERFNLTDLSKIEIIKQKLYENGFEALEWETKLKQLYKEYQYKGPKILKDGNTELFTEDVITMYYKANNLDS